jgi:hypothetical protein
MGNTDSLDSPWPGLKGSHHLPPYSILYVFPPDLHPNCFLSQDSQGGVPKLSRFGLLRLWKLITPNSDLQLEWGLKQTCSSPQELSNSVSHSTCTHQDRVDSQLLMVRSQTANLTPGPSFDHNLCYRCSNDSCEAFWITRFQDLSNSIKNTSIRGVLTPKIKLWIFRSPEGL